MSTYLELAQTLRAEADIPGDGTPTTVAGQVGDLADCVRWIRQAWNDIQVSNGGEWKWMHQDFTLQTVSGTARYAFSSAIDSGTGIAIAAFRKWDLELPRPDCPRIYLTSTGVGGERELVLMPFSDFRRLYNFGPQHDNPPVHCTINDQDEIVLGPTPDDIYTVSGRFWRGSQVLTADDDVPQCPGDYHDLIWARALRKYAYKNLAPESLSRANEDDQRLYTALKNNQLPNVSVGPAMA